MAKKVKSLRRLRLALFTALFVVCGFPPTAVEKIKIAHAEQSVTLTGDGTVYSPYLLGSKAELETFRDIVNGANGQTRNLSASGRLTTDINLEGSEWEPIGGYYNIYQGIFDGAGYTVSGLNVNKTSTNYVGFFGYIRNATVKNLKVQGSVKGNRYVGGVVGAMGNYSAGNATVYNCINECSVYSSYPGGNYEGGSFGGIVGYINGGGNVVSKCINRGAITTAATGDTYSYAGGIAGYLYKSATIKNCINEATGVVTATQYSAGIVGYCSGEGITISGCYNHAAINNIYEYKDSRGSSITGGIVGKIVGADSDRATISYCGNTGAITGRRYENAGIVAEATRVDISYCYNTATIKGSTACGLVCSNYYVTITNSYNTGDVRSISDKSDITSGICGSLSNDTISYVFNRGRVMNDNGSTYPYTRRGSICGDVGTTGVVHHAYYLDSSYKDGLGTYKTSPNCSATKLTAAQMKLQSSFAGFDFENIWYMGENHPLLRHSHDFNVTADQSTHTLAARCERPYCEHSDEVFTLTLHAPTLERERDTGNANATLDADELALFNAGTGLNVSAENITYEKIEGSQVTPLGTNAPTTFGEYRAILTVGSEFVSFNYVIAKLEVEFDKEVTLDGIESDTTVSNLDSETATALLTDEEIQEYLNGKSVSINLKVTTEGGDLAIPALDKAVVKNSLSSQSNTKEGAYLDLSLYKTVGLETKTIHESDIAFNVTVDIPENLRAAPYGATRSFSLVRVHNGVAETLESTVDNGKISFSTNKFSTYVITYTDNYENSDEYITFTPEIVGENPDFIDEQSVDAGTTYTVNYKITHNDGFNSILLIPEYNTNVFAIDNIVVKETDLGDATITNGNGTKKILLENTGDKYLGTDEGSESFLTITYRLIAATPGDYRFGLNLNASGDNNCSAAYYIAEGEQKGEQTRMPIIVNEPTLTLITVQDGVIEIGRNTDTSNPVNYVFTYNSEEVGVQLVNELSTDSAKIEYTYNGDATPVINWYSANLTDINNPIGDALEGAPKYEGYYYIGISAPESAAYGAVEEVFALVRIEPLAVTVTIDNKESQYKDELAGLTYSTNVQPFEGDSFGIALATEATNTSPVGAYDITGTANPTGSYDISFNTATYTISPKQVIVVANDQQATYSGSEPTVDQTAYTVEGIDYALSLSVVIEKESGVNVGEYELTPSLSTTPANYSFTFEKGVFRIVSQDKDTAYFEAFFAGKEVTYNGSVQDLLELLSAKDEWWSYVASNNEQTDAGNYTVGITINLTLEEANNHTGGQTVLYFTKDGTINPAAITIVADDKTSTYGTNPESLSYTITEGSNFNNELTITASTENPIAPDTNVGNYTITVTAGGNKSGNYIFELVEGTYTVTKGQATVVADASNVYYNRDLIASGTGAVNTLDLSSNVVITYYSDYACTQEVTPTDVGTYYAKATILGTSNYDGASSVASFDILPVRITGVDFTYSHGNATWTAVTSDTGKTNDETGVEAQDLKSGTTITYEIYNGDTLVATVTDSRSFDALAATASYKVVAVASDANYLSSESIMVPSYAVSFSEGNHAGNPSGEVSNLPATQYIFEGQTAIEPQTNPSVESCTFSNWTLNDVVFSFETAINGDITLVAYWDAITYTITLKYTSDSETLGTDVFEIENLYFNTTVNYSGLGVSPTKSSDDDGIYYTFANKWVDENGVEYDVVDNTITNFYVTEDMVFIAVFNTNYNSFTITYHFSDNESIENYEQYGETQSVQYGDTITYRNYDGAVISWFKADYWYANQARTEVVPTTMPNHNIDVYGTYKFNIGQGDVNADGNVSADDITLYRQWIVGGYEMTVVESGHEWELVTSQDFNSSAKYYLKRVADNNADDSRDIRDVSITRMAIVGGYDWDISTGIVVSGQSIDRTGTATSKDRVVSNLTQYGRTRLYNDITDTTADIVINANGNLYIDLGGYTLKVKSLTLNTNGLNATIIIKNGSIDATDGIRITAPNGNVILNNVTGYVNNSQVNLQAAENSLHLTGLVKFYKLDNNELVPAPIHVEEGTHVVIEQEAEIVAEKIVVTENFEPNENADITLDNNSDTEVIVDGNVKNYLITTYDELVDAATKTGDYVLGADIVYTRYITFTKDASLDLNGHTLRSTNHCALYVDNGATLTIYGDGNVIAQEACVVVFNGSSVIINGGTYTAYDNFVIGTNGSAGKGGNSITINGGTFNGNIQSAGYVACGIYVANSDTAVVNGGTFNITDGCGILARSGNTTINNGVTFNVTGNGSLGKVGDSEVTVPTGEALVWDLKANYPGGTPIINNNTSEDVYVVVDGTYTFAKDDASFHAARGVYDNVILDGEFDDYLYVTKDMNIYLNGHTVDASSTSYCAIYVTNGANVTINGNGLVKATEGCVLVLNGSSLTVNGGEYLCLDNFIFGTNGNGGNGNNSITINSGTFNGQIKSAGYVACGIYVANSDTVVVNGGTFNITNGCGILARSGNTTVSNNVVINATGNGSLGKVGDSQVTVPTGEALVLDLKANYPGGTPIINNNTSEDVYVVVDGTYTYANDDASFHAARGVYDNVILTADLNDYVYVNKDMNIFLNGHTIDASSTSYCAIYVAAGANVNIYGPGLVKATEGCALVIEGSSLIINGGDYLCLDNFVFGTNGSAGKGGNTITINGGTFNGQIKSAGYVACGIYVANSDTVVVNGGTFNITNGCGILARSGNTTVSNNVVINATGNGSLGKVGDSQVTVPTGEALVLDLKANYPGGTPTLNNNSNYNVYTVEAE